MAGLSGKYEGIDPRLVDILRGVSERLNIPLQVNSGYRPGDSGMHGSRLAADVQIRHLSDEQKAALVQEAHRLGATRFITYDTSGHLHIDLSKDNGPFWPMHTPAGTGPKGGSNRHMGAAPAWFQGVVSEIQGAPQPAPAPAVDPRMASTEGGGFAVSPHTLPDKFSLPPLPAQTPDTMMDYSQPHPALQAILAQQQPRETNLQDALLAMGTGILSSGGGPGAGNWMAGGFRNVQDLLQARPEELGALEYLQANASLWQLEQKNMERQQAKMEQQRRQEYLRGIAENESLPAQMRLDAQNQLMGVDAMRLPDAPELPSKIREAEALAARLGIPIEDAYARVGYGAEGDDAAKWYGGGMPVTLEGGRQGVAITNDQGELEIRMLPEGAELRGTPGFESAVAGGRATAENIAKRYDALVAETSSGLANVNSALSGVTRLINGIDEGRYSNTGLVRGAINTALGDVDNALLQLQTVNAQLQGLQITNLAPVTEKELELMSRLYASIDRTPAQNRAILVELQRSYESKKRVLEQVNEQIRAGKPVYEIMMDLPALYEPDTTVGGGEQSEADIEQEMMDLANEQGRSR